MRSQTLWIPLMLLGLGVLFSQCGALSKTQVRRSKNYFETVTNYPSLIRTGNDALAHLELEANNLKSALEPSNQDRINVIIEALNEYEKVSILADSVEKSLLFIERYNQKYYLLVKNGFDTYSTIKGASNSLGPIGGVASLFEKFLFKEPSMRPNKRKKLQNHLLSSHDSLNFHLDRLDEHLTQTQLFKLQDIERKTRKQFEELLQSIGSKGEPIEFYQNYNRELSSFYTELYLIQRLLENLNTSVELLKQAEKGVVENIVDRQKIDPESQRISTLLRQLEKARNLVSKLESP